MLILRSVLLPQATFSASIWQYLPGKDDTVPIAAAAL